jgi:hypothetical protein
VDAIRQEAGNDGECRAIDCACECVIEARPRLDRRDNSDNTFARSRTAANSSGEYDDEAVSALAAC